MQRPDDIGLVIDRGDILTRVGNGHGGNVFAAASELGVDWRSILDYSANINPLGPPPGLKRHLFGSFGLTAHYPAPYAEAWLEGLAAGHNLNPGHLLAGNGTTDLIYLLARVLKPQRAAIVVPAFTEYELGLNLVGAGSRHIPCRFEDNFDITAEMVEQLYKSEADMIFLANPTSPAGRLIEPSVMEMVLDLSRRSQACTVVDEAFLDFTQAESLVSTVDRHRNLLVLRSMTKFYALPGLRLGYLAGGEELVRGLREGQAPWAVNSLAQAAGVYCLQQEAYARRTREVVSRERTWLTSRLNRSGLGQVIPGTANYILVKLGHSGLTEMELTTKLRNKGILIRGCSSFQGLEGYIRVAVKNRQANRMLAAALDEVIQGR
jgi:threonine-phosphate decarboxylase